jgi:hypothetical protein
MTKITCLFPSSSRKGWVYSWHLTYHERFILILFLALDLPLYLLIGCHDPRRTKEVLEQYAIPGHLLLFIAKSDGSWWKREDYHFLLQQPKKKKPFPHLEDLFDQLNGVVFYMFISSLAIIKWPNQICVHELERIHSLLVMIIMNM